MNLYHLLERYTWEGVMSYHFQFHRKHVARGKHIYHPTEWRQLDSQLIASKCFAHPVLRPSWPQTQKLPQGQTRPTTTPSYSKADHRNNYSHPTPISTNTMTSSHLPQAPEPQPCRNWNYRECKLAPCPYQHRCITCGSSHRASQCPLGTTNSSYTPRISQPGH